MVTKSTDSGISQRTNLYAEAKMLKHAQPVLILDKTGPLLKKLPKNKTDTIKFRRPIVFTPATTPLAEGVTPTMRTFSYEDESVQLKQYGDVIGFTDVIEDTHEDPVINDMSEQSGENIGRTMEALNWGVLKGGTNVFYGNGTSRSTLASAISRNKQRAVTRFLKAQKGMKITTVVKASPNYETRGVEASFIAVSHTDLESDIRSMTGFKPTVEYGHESMICDYEIGRVEDVRYMLSPDLNPILAAGASEDGTYVSAGAANNDVYPVLYFAREAWGTVALRGKGAVAPSIIPTTQTDKSDPLNQRGYVGWKTYHAALILNNAWMARLEVCATEL